MLDTTVYGAIRTEEYGLLIVMHAPVLCQRENKDAYYYSIAKDVEFNSYEVLFDLTDETEDGEYTCDIEHYAITKLNIKGA